ncbi:YDG/SRA domain-containing protein [Diaporthe helianthi]|uniref:YDG/SRA domain-containing protein n=1 Tax=Diaporthe helianthi TaxID=158607 RepID=A0A2P5HQM6_DIAHE|nr:YDG/SRA domain-containing protein [Diaporthe helianthi]
MPKRSGAAAPCVRHPDDTRRPEDRLRPRSVGEPRWVRTEVSKITKLIDEFRKSRGNQLSREGQEKLAYVRQKLFPYMRFDMRMYPKLRDFALIDIRLQEVIDNDCGLPEDLVAIAELLYEKFDNEGWGDATARPKRTEGGPPEDHPIWGIDGIMHGAILDTDGEKMQYKVDYRYSDEARDYRVYGHNGLTPGDWFPRAVIAGFKGAHQGMIRGICGDAERGAYAITVSGQYEEDLDKGDVLYYSGEGADKNENPSEVSRRATNESLIASWETRRPVRVLRSAAKDERHRHYSPRCGIRYDGPYRVTDVQLRHNARGGLYQRFKLERIPGQEDLEDIAQRSPTAAQERDFGKVKMGY